MLQTVASEVAHWSALIPMALLLAFWRNADAPYWLVAAGFAVSFVADSISLVFDGTWALYHVYPALQLGLFALAFGVRWALPLLVAVAAFQVFATPLAGPDVTVTLIGSVIVLYLARDHPLAWSMVAYCGLASVFYLLMVENLWAERFMTWWLGYQASRLLAFALFGRAAWRAA